MKDRATSCNTLFLVFHLHTEFTKRSERLKKIIRKEQKGKEYETHGLRGRALRNAGEFAELHDGHCRCKSDS
jgi:hypothetical protein